MSSGSAMSSGGNGAGGAAATVAAACHADEIASPRDFARSFANRKVMRFLDDVALPPFVTVMELYNRVTGIDPTDVAIFTVSAWEAPFHHPEVQPAPDETMAQALSRHYYEQGNPTEWLRNMPSNAICQAAIARGFRATNAHYVGDGAAVVHALLVAAETLASGDADLSIVVAFDSSADGAVGAAGLALASDRGQPALDVPSAEAIAATAGTGALPALAACVAAVRRWEQERAPIPIELDGRRVGMVRDPADRSPTPAPSPR